MENKVIHRADTRGFANHGWLKSHHTFSFAGYYDPNRVHFGVLRVLNDDQVEAGMGFGTHPHDNMEIISIPLEGDLEHKDSMGTVAVIRRGDVQVMSAGTGITHSEYNRNKDQQVKFLQIWVIPNQRNVAPRYGQVTMQPADMHNKLLQVVSPKDGGSQAWIHQDAWFHMSRLDAGNSLSYDLKKDGNGLYAFILSGEVTINGEKLGKRDGMGMWNTSRFDITAGQDAEILLMEVPMTIN